MLPDDEQARQWTTDELSKGVYQEAKPSLFDQIANNILDWLGSLLNDIAGVNANLGSVVITVAAVLLIGLAIWLIKPRLNRSRAQEDEMFDDDTLLAAAQHRSAAAAASEKGNFSQAVLEQFRAIVRAAEERAVIDPRPGRTAGEVARQLQTAFPDRREALAHAARLFNEIRYGDAAGGRPGFEELVELDRDLLNLRPVYAGNSADSLSLP